MNRRWLGPPLWPPVCTPTHCTRPDLLSRQKTGPPCIPPAVRRRATPKRRSASAQAASRDKREEAAGFYPESSRCACRAGPLQPADRCRSGRARRSWSGSRGRGSGGPPNTISAQSEAKHTSTTESQGKDRKVRAAWLLARIDLLQQQTQHDVLTDLGIVARVVALQYVLRVAHDRAGSVLGGVLAREPQAALGQRRGLMRAQQSQVCSHRPRTLSLNKTEQRTAQRDAPNGVVHSSCRPSLTVTCVRGGSHCRRSSVPCRSGCAASRLRGETL